MQHFLNNWKNKKEYEQIIIINRIFFASAIFAQLLAFISYGKISFWFLLFIAVFFFSERALKSLSYSFWSSALFMLFFVTGSLFKILIQFGVHGPFYFYLFAVILLIVELRMLHSPIYYPLVNWWEYDFRFRSEIKIRVLTKDGHNLDGRLTDLRQLAGCVVLFEELNISDVIQIITQDKFQDIKITAEIISKRTPFVGRGNQYGVKFLYKSNEEKREISDFVNYWKRHRKMIRKLRFSNGKDRPV